jgi:hypothetical protein
MAFAVSRIMLLIEIIIFVYVTQPRNVSIPSGQSSAGAGHRTVAETHPTHPPPIGGLDLSRWC